LTSDEAKICRDCGSLNYNQPQSHTETRYGRMEYEARPSGSYGEEFNADDDYDDNNDWEDNGDPECAECGSTDLTELTELTTQQFEYIFKLPDDDRVEIVDKMLIGEFQAKERKNAKYIGGGKVFQC
jgi:hypothetical protein